MNFTISPCTEGDAEYIWEMDKAESVCAGSCSDGSEELIVFKIESEKGGIIGGCIAGVSGWDAAHIDLVWVDARFRGLGLEAALIGEIEREAKTLGAYIVRTDAGEAQAKFFAALGYDIVVVYEGSPDWFVMQKRL